MQEFLVQGERYLLIPFFGLVAKGKEFQFDFLPRPCGGMLRLCVLLLRTLLHE